MIYYKQYITIIIKVSKLLKNCDGGGGGGWIIRAASSKLELFFYFWAAIVKKVVFINSMILYWTWLERLQTMITRIFKLKFDG